MRRTVIALAIALPVLLVAWDLVQLSLMPSHKLADTCAKYYDRYGYKLAVLPSDAACDYLIRVRDPNPNQPIPAGGGHTLFSYVLTGHGFNGAVNKPGSQAILDHFLRRGIDWNKTHHPVLPPPLHLAVKTHSADLVERLLKAGADPRHKTHYPMPPLERLDAFDYARSLRVEAGRRDDEAAVRALLKIEALVCDDASVNQHAAVGLQNIRLDPKVHTLLPMDALADENLYPADNYDVLQGVITGPIGDHKSARFALVGVWDFENVGLACVPLNPSDPSNCTYDPQNAKAPSRLEAIIIVPGDPTKDGDLGWSKTIKLTSLRSTEHQEARLLGVDSMTVKDVDGQFEIRATARFAMGCHGTPFSEVFGLKITGDIITRTQSLMAGLGVLNGAKDLSALLRIGQTAGPKCSDPLLPVRPEAPTDKIVRAWPIHSAGVGELSADGPIPTWLLKREKKTLKELLTDGRPADEMEAMIQGYIDQDGFRIIALQSLDLKIRYSSQDRIMVLYPGKTLRTAEGTGLGSTLGQLLGAHGSYTMTNWPEPYHCGVHVQGYEGVSFAFTTCEEACAGAKVQKVVVAGFDLPILPASRTSSRLGESL
jgi:hypothetical protein